MPLRKNKTLLDQASEYVDSVRPQVESAASTAKEAVAGFVETTAKPALKDAAAKAGPALADAKDRTAVALADARDAAAPVLADAKTKAAPVVAAGAAKASKKAKEAKEAASAAAAQARGEQPKKKGGKLKKLAFFAAIAGAAGFVASRLRGSKESDNWQSSYVPTPAPSGTSPVKTTGSSTNDVGGSSPDEAMADAAEEPHEATTPDDPATLVDVENGTGEEPRP